MKLRTLKRYIERKLDCGQLFITADDTDGQYIFGTRMGRIVGIIDRGDHYDVHDMHNPDDQPGKPTAVIIKGRNPQWKKNTQDLEAASTSK